MVFGVVWSSNARSSVVSRGKSPARDPDQVSAQKQQEIGQATAITIFQRRLQLDLLQIRMINTGPLCGIVKYGIHDSPP